MRIDDQLDQLEVAGLIRQIQHLPELQYLFRHSLVQEATYASLLRRDRRQLHRAVGMALEHLWADRVGEVAPLLAAHFAEAGDHTRALQYFTLAGDHEAEQYANAEASMHYGQALDLAMQNEAGTATLIELYSKRGRVLELGGRYDEALAVYEELGKRGHQRGDQAMQLTALIQRATIHATPNARFNAEHAEALSHQALALARTLQDVRAEAKVLWNLLLAHRFSLRFDEAIQYGEQSLALARAHNLRQQLAYTLHDLSNAYASTGQLDRAVADLEESRALWRELNNLPMLADNLNRSASTLYRMGRHDEAIALAQEALRISRAIKNVWGQADSLMNITWFYFDEADFPETIVMALEGIALSDEAGFRVAQMTLRGMLATVYLTLGLYDEALSLTRHVMGEGYPLLYRLSGKTMTATIYVTMGRLDEAETLLSEVKAEAVSGDDVPGFLTNALLRAEIELDLARQRYADVLEKLSGPIEGAFSPVEHMFRVDMLRGKAFALAALGRLGEARDVLNETHALAKAVNLRRILWLVLGDLAMVEARLGNTMEAQHWHEQARALIDDIAARLDDRMRGSFLNTAAVRRILQGTSVRIR